MNLRATLRTNDVLRAKTNMGGKGSGGASDWEHLKDKPFETLGDDFTVDNGALEIADGVIPSLDGYATEDYVDSAVAAITPTIPVVSATSTLSSGTEIGSITIDGVTTTYYAPSDTEDEEIDTVSNRRIYFDLLQYYDRAFSVKEYEDVDKIVDGSTLTVEYIYNGNLIQDEVIFKAKHFSWTTSNNQGEPTKMYSDYGYYCSELLPCSDTLDLNPLPEKCLGFAFYEHQNRTLGLAFFPISMDMSNVSSVRIFGTIERSNSVISWDDIQDKPAFANVATSGDYDDLSNKPFNSIGAGLEVVNGKLKETVPIGTEVITTEYDWYWCLGQTDWTYDAQADTYTHILTEDEKLYMNTIGIYYNEIKYQGSSGPLRTSEGVFEYDSANNRYVRMLLGGVVVLYYYPTTGELVQSSDERYNIYFYCGEQVIEDYNLNTYPFYETETVFHELDADYINIDNDTIINDSGVLKANIPTVPSDVSAFNNDAGYITSTALTPYVETSSLATVATSGDYDDLSNKPVIPAATSVTVSQTLSSGTAIADIDVDSVTTTLYAPTPTQVVVAQGITTGTTIGIITVDGVTTELYAPAGGGGGSQADWAQTDSTADSYIQNKPAVYAGTDNGVRIGVNNASYNISATTNSLAIGRQTNVSRGGIKASEEALVIGRKYDNYDGTLSASHSALAIGEVDAASSAVGDYVWAQYGSIALKGKRNGSAYGHNTTISAQNGSFAAGVETYRGTVSAKDGSIAFGQAGIPSTSSQRTEITANKTSFAGGKSTYNSSRHGVYAGYNPETGTTNGIAFAFGENVRAYQVGSVAMGQSVEAQSPSQMAVGSFNVIDNASTYNFIVGNGTAHASRSNSFAAGADGNIYVSGDIYANVSNFTDPTNNGVKLAAIPAPPTTDGTYTLQVIVSNGTPTYSWI